MNNVKVFNSLGFGLKKKELLDFDLNRRIYLWEKYGHQYPCLYLS